MSYVDEVLESVRQKNAGEPEFIQAVTEVMESIRVVVDANEEKYRKAALLERLVERSESTRLNSSHPTTSRMPSSA